MLLEISIKNFAIIEEIALNFETGMTVLTGETGAGKSIIIDAMNMMLGSRATTDVIRHGAPKAEIEGLFAIDENRALQQLFEEQGLEWADGQPLCPQGGWSAFGRYSWSARSGRTDAGSIAYRYAG